MSSRLQHFVGRRPEIVTFLDLLHGNGSVITFLTGESGTGKSWLLRYLQLSYCKRLSQEKWQAVRRLADDEQCKTFLQTDGTPAKSILLDFSFSVAGKSPTDQLTGLLLLYLAMKQQAIVLPTFQYAAIIYIIRSLKLDREKLEALFRDLAAEDTPFNIIGCLPFQLQAGANKQNAVEIALMLDRYRRFIDDEALVQLIEQMDPDTELFDALPEFLGKDLNNYVKVNSVPVVLMFDSYDAFWAGSPISRFDQTNRDLWLRKLLISLELKAGIICLIAGRQKPHWTDAPQYAFQKDYLKIQVLQGLARQDCNNYLARTGVTDDDARQILLKNAQIGAGKIHPLYLALCTDALNSAREKRPDLSLDSFSRDIAISKKGDQLSCRFLNYFDSKLAQAIRILSACRSFDYEAARMLCAKLKVELTAEDYSRIIQLSFVERINGFCRIHHLVRTILESSRDKQYIQAHSALQKHFERLSAEKNELSLKLESIYHLNILDWQAGISLFLEAYRGSTKLLRAAECRLLLSATHFLIVNERKSFVEILKAQAEYFSLLGYFPQALTLLLEAKSELESPGPPGADYTALLAPILLDISETAQMLHLDSHALEYGNACIKLCNELLLQHSSAEGIPSLYLRARLRQAESESAAGNFQNACRLFEEIFQFACSKKGQESSDWALYAGNTFAGRAICAWKQQNHAEAIAQLASACKYFDEAIASGSEVERALINKCNSLSAIASLCTDLGQLEQAGEFYRRALESADKARRQAPHSLSARINHAGLMLDLADCFQRRKLLEQAEKTYASGLFACEELFAEAPRALKLYELAARGNTGLARVLYLQQKYEEASEVLGAAIDRLETAASFPGVNSALFLAQKADLLLSTALCASALNQNERKSKLLSLAIEIYEKLAAETPSNSLFNERLQAARRILSGG